MIDPTKGCMRANGSIKVEVDVQIWTEAPLFWVPKNRLRLDMLDVLESAVEADVYARFLVFHKTFCGPQKLACPSCSCSW